MGCLGFQGNKTLVRGKVLILKELLPHTKVVFQMPTMLATSAIHPELPEGQTSHLCFQQPCGVDMVAPVFTDEGLNFRNGRVGPRPHHL